MRLVILFLFFISIIDRFLFLLLILTLYRQHDALPLQAYYTRVVMYTASISVILAAARMFRSMKDVPGFRVYALLFEKAMPRFRDFSMFFILILLFLGRSTTPHHTTPHHTTPHHIALSHPCALFSCFSFSFS